MSLYNVDVDIYSKSTTSDFRKTITWSFVDQVEGRLSKLSGYEVVKSEGDTIVANYIVFMDVTTSVTGTCRLVVNGSAYEIHDIDNPDEMDHHLEIKVLKLTSSDYEAMGI